VRAGSRKEFSMKSYNKRPGDRCHGLAGLTLFDWRQKLPRRPPTPAGAYVTRKFGVLSAIANVVADLVGLGRREATQ
jgi:hypothetical protein